MRGIRKICISEAMYKRLIDDSTRLEILKKILIEKEYLSTDMMRILVGVNFNYEDLEDYDE